MLVQNQDLEFQQAVRERFTLLPKPVQDAILSADVSKHLRDLAQTHQLHVDQWSELETEVQMTLMGMHHAEDLAENIKKSLSLDEAAAASLAEEIYRGVFDPIRAELERELKQPTDATSTDALASAPVSASETPSSPALAPQPVAAAPVAPATPPAELPGARALREALSQNYAPGEASHERKVVEGDPYREQLT